MYVQYPIEYIHLHDQNDEKQRVVKKSERIKKPQTLPLL